MRNIKRFVVSLLVVGIVVGGMIGASLALGLRPRLGLDLRGGLSVTLTAPDGTRADVLDKTVDILRNRVDRAGVAEPEIAREGSTNILIQLPGTEDPQRLLDLIGRTAQLQFRQVQAEIPKGLPEYETTPLSESDDASAEVVLLGVGDVKYQLAPAELTGEAVRDASAILDPNTGGWSVELRFNREGARTWEQFTGRLACLQGLERRVAIVLDGRVESAPGVDEDVQCNVGIGGGDTVITGQFTETDAKDLALVLTTGALPVELEQSEVRTVSPTLGQESLRAGLIAGALGLTLVMLYVLVYYRALGLQTWLGLVVFAGFIYGLIVILGAAIGWSLTLAGIAGLIVSIGIATDSYIVFFERVKEEVHLGKTLRSSMDRGFPQAWRTLRAANAVTIMAAIVLYLLAVGPVRGFALTLGMATTLDLILFVAMTWPLAALLARSRLFGESPLIGMRRALEGAPEKPGRRSRLRKIYRSEFNVDFIGRRRTWLIVSAVLVLGSVIVLLPGVRGLTFGIDFRGGTILRSPLQRDVSTADVRRALAPVGGVGQTDVVVQILRDPTTDRGQVQVQTGTGAPVGREEMVRALAEVAGVEVAEVGVDQVGAKWGGQITSRALRGVGIFFVLVVLYMSLRLEPKMAFAAMVALLHDLALTAGIYAVVGFSVSPASVIAILTILGYSLYDTVVVFDKIRENVALPSNARRSFRLVANESMNQVLMRSINTSLTTLLPVGSLLFVGSVLLGADTLQDLALALFVGIAAGTYSSMFVASPVLSILKEREPRYASVREKVLRETREPGAPKAEVIEESEEAAAAVEPDEPAERERAAYAAIGGEASSNPQPDVRPDSRPDSRAKQYSRVQQRRRSRRKRRKGRR